MTRARSFLLLLVVGCGAGCASPPRPVHRPRAVAARASGQIDPRLVLLLAARDQARVSSKAIGVIRSQVVDLGVKLEVRWMTRYLPGLPSQVRKARQVALSTGAFVALWNNFGQGDPILVIVLDPRSGRALIRPVRRSREGVLGVYEAIGTIVRSSVQALRAGGRIGIIPPSLQAVRPSIPPPVPKRRLMTLSLEGAYTAALHSAGPRVLHGGYLGLNAALGKHWSTVAGMGLFQDLVVREPELILRVGRHPLLLGGRVQGALGKGALGERFLLAGQLHLSLDILSRRAEVLVPTLTATPAKLDVAVGLGARLIAGFRVWPWMTLQLTLGADVWVRLPEYYVLTDGQRRTILKPWLVQPCLLVGLSFRVL